MAYFQVLGGLVLLVFAGDFLVRGSVSIAQRFGIPTILIGLTVVAFGTSAPEMVVGINAVLSGVPTLALGNVVGSNIANIWLVIGVPAIIAPMMCATPKFTQNMIIMLGISVIFMALASTGMITLQIGLVFIMLLVGFLYFSARRAQASPNYEELLVEIDGVPDEPDSPLVATTLIVGGLVGLIVGANLLVTGSVDIARALGVSEAVIGLTLVAIGTSVPELVTALVAAVRKEADVALGNVIGSNIFNILAILGASSMFGNIPVPEGFLEFDLWVMLAASLMLLPFAVFQWNLGRRAGLLFTGLYIAYIYILSQGGSAMSGTY